MKKITILLTTVLLFYSFTVLLVSTALAVGPQEATRPGIRIKEEGTPPGRIKIPEERREQIKELRERLATRVAQLKEKMRRAWHGEIKSISGTTIILTTRQGEKTIVTDENTSFLRTGLGGRRKITLADLSLGEKIVAFGQVSQDTGEMTAKVIIAQVFPVKINGKVTAVNVEGGTITVQTLKRGSFIVDVETTTKILVWEKKEGLKSFGLSKIKVGDRVHVNGTTPTRPKQGENRITASRILVLPGRAVGITGEKPASPAGRPATPAGQPASPTATPTTPVATP